jgi:hypothetical protein
MLPAYGVVVGQFVNYTTNQGQWMHVDLNINAAGAQYQAAVDVNEPNGLFQYQVFNELDMNLFGPIAGLSAGWHPLASTAASGAMDYARSPILQRPLGCLAIFWAMWNAIFRTSFQTWTNVTGNEAGDALVDKSVCFWRALHNWPWCPRRALQSGRSSGPVSAPGWHLARRMRFCH